LIKVNCSLTISPYRMPMSDVSFYLYNPWFDKPWPEGPADVSGLVVSFVSFRFDFSFRPGGRVVSGGRA
ncbi:uncharacterized protein H6S33_001470, partial [Morchella sextelata]|uniref:uncharacterized protein n=1 Tax=Morchella sextelata TaxID=1174677 RepID=UPI001D0375F9